MPTVSQAVITTQAHQSSNAVAQYEVNRILTSQEDPFEQWIHYIEGMEPTRIVTAYRSLITSIGERDAIENEFVYKLLRWGQQHPTIL